MKSHKPAPIQLWLLIGIGCIFVGCCLNLSFPWAREAIWRYQISLTPTPTPHYQPMSGIAYVVGAPNVLTEPSPYSDRPYHVGPGMQVEILEAQWYYERNRDRTTACYFYRVRSPRDDDKWLPQDDLTQTPGMPSPPENKCRPSVGYPNHPPLLGMGWDWTNVGPNRRETPGWGYVNVGEGQGAPVFSVTSPYEYTGDHPVLCHGVLVEIREARWYFQGNDGCYMYQIRDPESGVEGWLPEDVLSADLSQSPPEHCLLFVDRELIIKPIQPQ